MLKPAPEGGKWFGGSAIHIFFDMDYTILAVDGTLRPGVQELFQRLKEDGHTLYIWSGMGVRKGEVQQLGLDGYVDGVFEKPIQDYQQVLDRKLAKGELPALPNLVVDDYPEIVSALGGILVKPYFFKNPSDREMERIYDIIRELSQNGHSPDSAFRPRRQGF
ncbi:MAG: hypothetical protein HY686_00190 [Chloroflexi bacterium]|nr:hypothetical protein [Chloroflexota bacterium]